ncbi:hypothetical protein BRO54_2241 [Geobacillus proteiniphilus]|uniref:Uncharacterized protein n=1 Tax=Geobacillus proteiniphilus TaxID=860353 RepID=A0A1Q5SY56_9BACL|nr:hypothetical protein BRO54_2241 [Geobacillus proteiniphilus]
MNIYQKKWIDEVKRKKKFQKNWIILKRRESISILLASLQ